MKWIEHIEMLTLLLTPVAGVVAMIVDFSWTNLILFSILMLIWGIRNNQVSLG